MRVDIRHLVLKGANKKLSDRLATYVQLMKEQGKPVERVVITTAQYDAIKRCSRGHGEHVVLCCGDALVYYNYAPIDESAPERVAKPRFDAGLPPVAANPFGVAAPVVVHAHSKDDDVCERCGGAGCARCNWQDDDIPF